MENQNRKPKAAQRGMVAAIIIPLVAAIISAFGGALANHYFASLSAADKTVEGIDTFLGVALSTVELARRTQAAPELVVKLEQLVSQSRAIQVNLQLLNRSSDGASREVDFWLPFGQSVVLGEKNSFGIQKRGTGGGISRRFNEQMMRAMFPGNRLAYETSSGKECFLAYIGPSPDGDLHGFRTLCSEEKWRNEVDLFAVVISAALHSDGINTLSVAIEASNRQKRYMEEKGLLVWRLSKMGLDLTTGF